VLADVYKSVCLYKAQAPVRTYTYNTGVVHLTSSTGAVKYESTGAVKYLSTGAFILISTRGFNIKTHRES
jgi:hypothetical protein